MIRWWIWSFTWTRLVEIHCTIITSSIVLERISRRIDGPCGHSRTVVEQQFFCQNIFPNRHHVPELLPPGPWETGPANPQLNSANTWYGINTCAQFLLTLLLPRVVWNNNLTENTSFWYTMYMLVYVPNVFFMNHVLVFWLFLYTNNTSANIAMFFIIYPQLTGSWPVAMRCDSLTAGRPW